MLVKREEKRELVPVWQKVVLNVEEASAYSGIGINKLRDISDKPDCDFVLWVGNKRMFKREKLDKYLQKAYSV